MDTNKMREQFEAYWKRQLWAECYADVKEQMLTVWKASREAVAVELPGSFGAMTHPCSDKEQVMDAQEVREAIEAQGLKVSGNHSSPNN